MIGVFEETIPQIYYNLEHKTENVWLAFNNPDGNVDSSLITGVMKVSF